MGTQVHIPTKQAAFPQAISFSRHNKKSRFRSCHPRTVLDHYPMVDSPIVMNHHHEKNGIMSWLLEIKSDYRIIHDIILIVEKKSPIIIQTFRLSDCFQPPRIFNWSDPLNKDLAVTSLGVHLRHDGHQNQPGAAAGSFSDSGDCRFEYSV